MHWRNSNFQYAYFIFGSCHTLIEAHRKCMEAIEDRELSIFEARQKHIDSDDVRGKQFRASFKQAETELEFLKDCRLKMEKMIGHVPTMVDYQMNQREEWRLELEHRAENYLLTTASIPTDQFATMRMHPDFPQILARIHELRAMLNDGVVPDMTLPAWREKIMIEGKI